MIPVTAELGEIDRAGILDAVRSAVKLSRSGMFGLGLPPIPTGVSRK